MNNSKIYKSINLFILFIIIIQIFIIYINSKVNFQEIQKKNMSIENFSSFVLSKYGITTIGSERLNRMSTNNIFLEGYSYLENKVYKMYGEDISIDTNLEISSSEKPVEVINSMGTMNADGFKNIGSEGRIFFIGKSKFIFHE